MKNDFHKCFQIVPSLQCDGAELDPEDSKMKVMAPVRKKPSPMRVYKERSIKRDHCI